MILPLTLILHSAFLILHYLYGSVEKRVCGQSCFNLVFLAFSKTVATQRSAFLKNQKNSLQAENHRLSAEIFNTLFIYFNISL